MKEVFFVVEEVLEGGFTARALGESILQMQKQLKSCG